VGIGQKQEIAMTEAIRELKIRAEILHKQLTANDAPALKRLHALPEFRRSTPAIIKRRDCLTVIAAELGFPNWTQAKAALAGDREVTEFGTLLCPPGCCGHINRWYVTYEQAAPEREAYKGYLLAYKRQYLVVDRYYIESLGLEPDDNDWKELGFDWVHPASLPARTRLYNKLIERTKPMDRKAAIREFKERKVPQGIFAVRCTTTGQVWVESSTNLNAAKNALFFCLRLGNHYNKSFQAESNVHGEQAFEFEILEKLKDDEPPIGVRDLLKEKKRHWITQLNAQAL
jgi:hypothetical protein